MLDFAFKYFNLNYKNHVKYSKQFTIPKEIKSVKVDLSLQEKKNKIFRKPKIYGKKMIIKLIKYYSKKNEASN